MFEDRLRSHHNPSEVRDPSPNTLPFDAPHLHPPLVGPPVSEVAELDLRYDERIL